MSDGPTSILLGLVGALPLLVGAWYALWRRPAEHTVGRVAAFGAGALLSAVSFELVLESVNSASPAVLAPGLAAGALVYYAGDRLLSRRAGAEDRAARGRALMMGAMLDGIPESFILGLSVAAGGGASVAFLMAVVVSNLPEGMASAAELSDQHGLSTRHVLSLWVAVVAVCTAAAGIGGLVAGTGGANGAFAQAFAAGALLTMVTDDLIPEARGDAGVGAGLLTVLGFAVAFALYELGG